MTLDRPLDPSITSASSFTALPSATGQLPFLVCGSSPKTNRQRTVGAEAGTGAVGAAEAGEKRAAEVGGPSARGRTGCRGGAGEGVAQYAQPCAARSGQPSARQSQSSCVGSRPRPMMTLRRLRKAPAALSTPSDLIVGGTQLDETGWISWRPMQSAIGPQRRAGESPRRAEAVPGESPIGSSVSRAACASRRPRGSRADQNRRYGRERCRPPQSTRQSSLPSTSA